MNSLIRFSVCSRIYLFDSKYLNRINQLHTLTKCIKSSNQSRFLKQTDIRFANQSTLPKAPNKKRPLIFISWKSVGVAFVFGSALLILMYKMKIEKEESIKRQRKQAIGKMAIGGPFELVDHTGKLVKSSDFLGNWLLIYFGFTHCPDICPEEMEKMIKAIELIEKVDITGAKILPLFITVDPTRDDVKTIEKYIKDFSPKFIGLTGDKKQIEQVTKAYRVYFSAGPMDEDKDYIVDHTVIMYLVDPEGNFVDYYGQNKNAEEIATAAAIHMGSFELNSKKKN